MKTRLLLTLSAFCFLVMGQLAYGSDTDHDDSTMGYQSLYPKLGPIPTTAESVSLPMKEVLEQRNDDTIIDTNEEQEAIIGTNEEQQESTALFSNRTKIKLKVLGIVAGAVAVAGCLWLALDSCHQEAVSTNSTSWCTVNWGGDDDGFPDYPGDDGPFRSMKASK